MSRLVFDVASRFPPQTIGSALARVWAVDGSRLVFTGDVHGTRAECPITLEAFAEPVLLADGFIYEQSPVLEWLQHHDTAPCTNDPLHHKNVLPLLPMKAIIEAFLAGQLCHDRMAKIERSIEDAETLCAGSLKKSAVATTLQELEQLCEAAVADTDKQQRMIQRAELAASQLRSRVAEALALQAQEKAAQERAASEKAAQEHAAEKAMQVRAASEKVDIAGQPNEGKQRRRKGKKHRECTTGSESVSSTHRGQDHVCCTSVVGSGSASSTDHGQEHVLLLMESTGMSVSSTDHGHEHVMQHDDHDELVSESDLAKVNLRNAFLAVGIERVTSNLLLARRDMPRAVFHEIPILMHMQDNNVNLMNARDEVLYGMFKHERVRNGLRNLVEVVRSDEHLWKVCRTWTQKVMMTQKSYLFTFTDPVDGITPYLILESWRIVVSRPKALNPVDLSGLRVVRVDVQVRKKCGGAYTTVHAFGSKRELDQGMAGRTVCLGPTGAQRAETEHEQALMAEIAAFEANQFTQVPDQGAVQRLLTEKQCLQRAEERTEANRKRLKAESLAATARAEQQRLEYKSMGDTQWEMNRLKNGL